MDNTLEHLHQHHESTHHLHHQMDHQLPTTTASGQSASMISYDQPAAAAAMHHNGDQDHHNHHHYGHMSMMKMYFHFGLGDMVLFPNLVMDSQAKLWLTCAALFLAALLLEMIDYSRGYLSCRCQSRTSSRRGKSASTSSSETGLVDAGGAGGGGGGGEPQSQDRHHRHRRQWNCCAGLAAPQPTGQDDQPAAAAGYGTWHGKADYFEPKFFPVRSHEPQLYRALQAGLQLVRTGLSLCLMLVAMTYNVCLISAILLGSALGYYIFYRPALDSKSVVCH